MGQGNRFKKQGPPAPLEDFLTANKKNKRKADAEPTAQPVKKIKKTNGGQQVNGVQKKESKLDRNGWTSGRQNDKYQMSGALVSPKKVELESNAPNGKNGAFTKAGAAEVKNTKTKSKPGAADVEKAEAVKKQKTLQVKKTQLPIDEDESEEDGIDDPDVMEDEFDTAEADRLDEYDTSEDELEDSVVDTDEERAAGFWSEDEDDEEGLDAANIESMSRHLDAKAAQEAADAQAELEEAAMQTNIAGDKAGLDDDADEEEPGLKTRLAPDLQLLRTRITDTIRILDDSKQRKESGKSRAELSKQLLKDICAYYGYSMFLAEKLFNLFTPQEAFAFFEANETPRPMVIRTNTLRSHRRELAQALINRGVRLEPVGKWSKVGLQIFESNVPIGATPEYLAGHYIMQAASSFLPVMALAPQEHERVLDMASAPGGKTTYMAALMKNTGTIFANDSNKSRAKSLIGNIHRLGVKNTIVCNYDAKEFPKVMGGFDRVLLDAPCSGTGVISKDPSVKTNKTEKDFMLLPHLQKQLLLCAIDSVDHASKTGGYIVYSTCSVTVEENEQVVQYALNKRPNVKLVETGLVFGKEGFTSYMGKTFHPSLKMTRRYYPHSYNVDGFFVSKFKKVGPSPSGGVGGSGPMVNGVSSVVEHAVENQAVPGSTEELVPNEVLEVEDDGFGGWDDEEDDKIIQRALRRQLKRKGLNPKASKMVNGVPTAMSSQKVDTGEANNVAVKKVEKSLTQDTKEEKNGDGKKKKKKKKEKKSKSSQVNGVSLHETPEKPAINGVVSAEPKKLKSALKQPNGVPETASSEPSSSSPQRPKTDVSVAKRMILGSLGLKDPGRAVNGV